MVRVWVEAGRNKTCKVIIKIKVEGKKERGRPKKRWLDMIENDMRAVGVMEL
jgi:hypothetical protein